MRMLLASLLVCVAACASGAAAGPRVRVESGIVEGEALAGGIRVFRSVPYAAPPVGALRWRAPQPAPHWRGVRAAKEFGPSCVQNISAVGWGPWTGEYSPQGAVSEDCLTLTIWTPARARTERLPIMLWVPGGGFTDGGEATPVYDAASLARRGIIVVSINYRVAAFGLLAHSALEPEVDGSVGNYALRDAVAALQWVHDNAAAFGGDRQRITIAGQSAGGALVYAMLAHPQMRTVVAGAIIQSFPPGSERLADAVVMRQASQRFAEQLGATTLGQLRAASAEAVLSASSDANLNLYVDGVTITDPMFAALDELADVPIMIGVTADETSFLRPNLAQHQLDAARYGEDFLRLYPAANDAEALDASLRANREGNLVGLGRWARARAHASPAATFMYLWRHSLPGANAESYRAFHSSELPYIFGSFAAAPQRPFTELDHAIGDAMMAYWSNFVKTGNPNGANLPIWPAVHEREPVFMELGDRFEPLTPLSSEIMAFFNAYYDRTGEFEF